MNKDSVRYFMCEMSQKEFEERNKDKIKCTYEFNRIQPERSKREDFYCEFGCSVPVSFITSEGIKTMEPGKKYDEHLNEI